MNLPECPHAKEHGCLPKHMRLLGENDKSFQFHCYNCKLLWAVSKQRTQEAARWENQARKVRELTEQERMRSRLPKVFYNPYDSGKRVIHGVD